MESSTPTPPAPVTLLVCISGPDKGKRLTVDDDAKLIGRGIDCHLISEDTAAENRHIAVLARDGRLAFEALDGSKVYLDGELMERGKLHLGQQLRIGRSLWQMADEEAADKYAGWLTAAGGKLSDMAGLDRVEGFSVRELFSQVFRKHSQEEIEDYLNVGSPTTTPAVSEVNSNWPTPWMFARAAVLSVLVYLGFWFAVERTVNLNFVPGLIITGSFAIPLSVLLFFIEMNVLRNISLWQIVKLFLVGAILSFGFSMILFSLTSGLTQDLKNYAPMVAGPVEETGKLMVMIIFASQLRYRWTLNGLLIGATVGCGFAAFESAGYAFTYGLNEFYRHSDNPSFAVGRMIDEMVRITNLRGLCTISGMHLVWSALIGAALWRVRGNRKFKFEMLTDWKFVRVFLIAVALHSLWNSPWFQTLPWGDGPLTQSLWPYFRAIPFGLVGWFLVIGFVNEGLKEVREAQKTLHAASQTIVNTIFSGGKDAGGGDDEW
ncbi:MAG: PrsW family intramembrane metalloprotease [Phycisphaerales bacterium]|nr:PrsW family intramembrane metalloprotease [Phycisphaerales bacterium]